MLLVVHLSFLHEKHWLQKLLIENQQTFAKLLLGMTRTNYTTARCLNPCRPVFIRVAISIQKPVDSHLDKTWPAALKNWSCAIFNEQDQKVKMKVSLQQVDIIILTALVLVAFVLIATLFLRSWVAFTTSVLVKKYVFLPLKRIFNVVARRESSMHWDDTIYKRKASMFLKCGSANGGDCTKQPILLCNTSQITFLTGVHLQLSNC